MASDAEGFAPGGTNSAPPPPRRQPRSFSLLTTPPLGALPRESPQPLSNPKSKTTPKKSAKNQKNPKNHRLIGDGGARAGGGWIRVRVRRLTGCLSCGGGRVPGDFALRG